MTERGDTRLTISSPFLRYNRYLAIAGRAVRRSLKEDKRLAAERRGQMDLRFSKWQVRGSTTPLEDCSDNAKLWTKRD